MAGLKILYYNWSDFDDPEQRGGGVSVYQKNLIDAAVARGDEVWFLSCGSAYAPFSRKPFLREFGGDRSVRKFAIVNSPIMSPGQLAFGQAVSSESSLEKLFAGFLEKNGPFDVVHFNNLEGIPVSFLRLARCHSPSVKVVFSIHNYFAVCPQVNLWFQEKARCTDFRDGRKCANCLVVRPNANVWKWRYRMEYFLSSLGIPAKTVSSLSRWVWTGPVRQVYRSIKLTVKALIDPAGLGSGPQVKVPAGERLEIPPIEAAASFAARRADFVRALNTHADSLLAVSGRVAEIAASHGLDAGKIKTLYIGTKFAKMAAAANVRNDPDARADRHGRSGRVLRLLYPGYMRHDKGFYFYLRALEKMPKSLAARLHLVFATKIGDPPAFARIQSIAHRFKEVTFYNGYTHSQLPQILAGVDLGIVPVLWEDNLPQVAIECVAAGVPILTSDRGGARELLDFPELVFRAGSYAHLFDRIETILDDTDLLAGAMLRRRRLFTPEEHYERLRSEIYEAVPSALPGRERRDPLLTPTATLCDTSAC